MTVAKLQISDELKIWIKNTLTSGVSPLAIASGMIKKGYDPKQTYEVLFQIVGNESIKTTEDAPQVPYEYESLAINTKGNVLKTTDREIKVLARNEKPFILHLDNVLGSEECDHLIQLSKERLQPSLVVDQKTGEEKLSTGRTSKGMSFYLAENDFIRTIEKRIAEITNYPSENGEGLQVLNYQSGEEYKPHFDYFPRNKVDANRGGQRVGTLLIYLNDVPVGGETVFSKIGLSIVPKKGSAVYFHYANSKGQVDKLSLHSSIPVLEGEKWVATKWIRENKIY